jgi:hypothetical protein
MHCADSIRECSARSVTFTLIRLSRIGPDIMSQIFISHVAKDEELASKIAAYIEAAGHTAWYYERDALPGTSYLLQTGRAIESAALIILIVSTDALGSYQMTKEIVRGHETEKPFIPILRDMSHLEFQERQPEWREAIGATTTIRIPTQGLESILPRIADGMELLGLPMLRQAGIYDTQRPEAVPSTFVVFPY